MPKFRTKKIPPHHGETVAPPLNTPPIPRIPYHLIGLCIIIGSVPFFVWSYDAYYQDKIFPGISIGTLNLSGVTEEDAEKRLIQAFDTIEKKGIGVSFGGKTVFIGPQTLSLNPDIPNESMFEIDAHTTSKRAYEYGKNSHWIAQQITKFTLSMSHQSIDPIISLHRDFLVEAIRKEFGSFEASGKNAYFSYTTESHSVSITPEEHGKEFNYSLALDDIQAVLEQVSFPSITLSLVETTPRVTAQNLEPLSTTVNELLSLLPIEFTNGDHVWQADAGTVAGWLTTQDGSITFDEILVRSFLTETIAPVLFIQALDPKFEMQDGKLILSQIPNNGRELNIDKTIEALRTEFLQNKQRTINLVIDVKTSDLAFVEHQPSIKEIVAKAETDFKGSPKNRRANIALGAKKMNGVLIEDGQEFSLIAHLGAIDKESGFLPELVIKGNKTQPEYGGGLCQVSTTLFRAVTFSGLPILERRNHSYRVSYYEPPIGFDATIYSPKPDFRFKNDTGNPILIQARVHGTKITVELWGTKDGRLTEVDEPRVFNIKKAGEAKIIETEALKPGEKKCTEKAHNGADAIFERRTTYPTGDKKTDVFKSHYIVWPAVCYVGKTKVEPAPAVITPTPEVPVTSPPQTTGSSTEISQ
ncbi:MAG: VanW family protein [bacterium]|nr:VanW family protein [bacterium]